MLKRDVHLIIVSNRGTRKDGVKTGTGPKIENIVMPQQYLEMPYK